MKDESVYETYVEFARRKKQYTNCYFTAGELLEKCSEKRITAEILDGSLLIREQESGYTKLYFMGDDFRWTDDLRIPSDKTAVIEIVKKGDLAEYDLSRRMKCREIVQYTRFRRKGFEEPDKLDRAAVTYCSADDLPAIRCMLDSNFTPIGDRIPTDAELYEHITNRSVICVRDGMKLIGYIIFEDKGKTSYLRNICVDDNFRGKGIGKELMAAYFYSHRDFKGFTLWCKTSNVPAMRLYTTWGGTAVRTSMIIFSSADAATGQGAA